MTFFAKELVVRELDESSWDRWEAYVAAHPQATFFHRAGWQRVIERSFDRDTHYLFAESEGIIRGILPMVHYKSRLFGNALISTGCCTNGGPLASDDQAYAALDGRAVELMEHLGATYIEYRQPVHRHTDWHCCDNRHATFEVAAEKDDAAQFKRMHPNRRRRIRRLLEGNLSVEVDKDPERLYPLFAASVRNLGTPVYPKAYFRNICDVFGEECEIIMATDHGTPMSGHLNFRFRDRLILYYLGGDVDARATGSNEFLQWQVIRRAARQGVRVVDWGRSKLGSGNYTFKKEWGFIPSPVVHEYRLRLGAAVPDINPTNPKYRVFINLWKRLPLPVANLLGPHLMRHIG